MKKNLAEQCARAREVVQAIDRLTEERNAFYKEHDKIVNEIRNESGTEIHGIAILRTFAKGNTQWGHGPVRELVMALVDIPKPAPKKRAKSVTP